MVEVLFVWGVIWFLYWGNTKPLKNRISRLHQSSEAQEERAYLNNEITRFGTSAMAASIGAAIGSFIGIAAIGSFIGIAGFGSAVAGTVPCAILAGLIGWLANGGKQ
jgi:uncharacterized protein (DUF2062 family)